MPNPSSRVGISPALTDGIRVTLEKRKGPRSLHPGTALCLIRIPLEAYCWDQPDLISAVSWDVQDRGKPVLALGIQVLIANQNLGIFCGDSDACSVSFSIAN